MFALSRNQLQCICFNKNPVYIFFYSAQISLSLTFPNHPIPSSPCNRNSNVSFYCTRVYKGRISRSLRKRINKRARAAAQPVLDEALFQKSISQLPPRFTAEELHNVIVVQDDPLVCLELYNWASHQHRFRHNVLTYHITIQKLGAARMYKEMDAVVNQVQAIPDLGSEALFNTMIYYYTQDRKLVRAVNIYRLMRTSRKFDCRPSIRTYNILFTAFLSHGKNTYISRMYMETIRCLFKHMADDGIEPDLFCLNAMIKGYVLSLHVNDALRIFHQMGVVYTCRPNSYSYDYLIHGLCAQGRTINAREFCDRMKESGFVPSSKSYNSLVCSLALEGNIDEAIKFFWEMAKNQRTGDFITYRTLLDETSRQKTTRDAFNLLTEFQKKNLIDGHMYQKLLCEQEDTSRVPYIRN